MVVLHFVCMGGIIHLKKEQCEKCRHVYALSINLLLSQIIRHVAFWWMGLLSLAVIGRKWIINYLYLYITSVNKNLCKFDGSGIFALLAQLLMCTVTAISKQLCKQYNRYCWLDEWAEIATAFVNVQKHQHNEHLLILPRNIQNSSLLTGTVIRLLGNINSHIIKINYWLHTSSTWQP